MTDMTDAPPATPETEPLGIGQVLGTSLGLVRRHFWLLALPVFVLVLVLDAVIGFVVYGVIGIHGAAGDGASAIGGIEQMLRHTWLASIGFVVELVLAIAIVNRVVFTSLSGEQRPGLGTALGGLARLPTLLVTGALIYFFLALIGVGMAAVTLTFGVLGGTILLLPFALVFYLWIASYLFVALPAAVVERNGGISPLPRSGRLTAGNRWRVLALVLISAAVAALAGVASNLLTLATLQGIDSPSARVIAVSLTGALTDGIVILTTAILPAVTYFELRRIREGVSAAEILRVFD